MSFHKGCNESYYTVQRCLIYREIFHITKSIQSHRSPVAIVVHLSMNGRHHIGQVISIRSKTKEGEDLRLDNIK